jgi:uncharacterized protein (TIGR02246 family)
MLIVRHVVFLLCALCFFAGAAFAQADDTAVVRSRVGALRDAVNKADATAAASLWTLDGTYLDELGVRFLGRDAVKKMFSEVFSVNAKPNVDLVRFVTKDVAVLDGTVRAAGRPTNAYSLTMVRSGNDWMISSGTETPILSVTSGAPLQQLNWLIGDWRAQGSGGNIDMRAEWVGQHHFILCRYEIGKAGQPKHVEGQVIGWDPRTQKPISWHFNGDGGFGQGFWTRNGNKWAVDMVSTAGDGTMLSATSVISELNKDKFTWQSVNRRRNGVWLEDTTPVTVERATK